MFVVFPSPAMTLYPPKWRQFPPKLGEISLRVLLIGLLLTQIVGTVGFMAYWSYGSGHQAVESVGYQLIQESTARIHDRLETYLQVPEQIVALEQLALEQGDDTALSPAQLESRFRQQLQRVRSPLSLYFARAGGDYLAVQRDPQGQIQTIHQTRSDPRQQKWYQMAAAHPGSHWLSIGVSQNPSPPSLEIVTAVDRLGQVQGVLGAGVPLADLRRLLEGLTIPPQGRAFIVDRSGNLIATATPASIGQPDSSGATPLLPRAIDSPDPLTRAMTRQLLRQWPNLDQLTASQTFHVPPTSPIGQIAGSEVWASITPYPDRPGLDWFVVVVVPASQFMSRIEANLQRTLFGGSLALLGMIVLGLYATRWIVAPIFALRTAAKRLAQGEFEPFPASTPIAELRDLTHSFNEMAQQLHQSFHLLQQLNAQLLDSKAWLAKFLDALPVGVGIHEPGGKATYFNQAAKQLLGTDTIPETTIPELANAYRLYVAGSDRPYPTEKLPAVQALQGKQVRLDDLEIRRSDGRNIVEAWATPIRDSAGQIIYAIVAFQDITTRKEADRILAQYHRELEWQVWKRTRALETEIQEHQKTEDALRDNQARFDSLAAAVPGVLYSYVRRRDGSSAFEYVSHGVETLYEQPISEILQDPEAVILGQMHPEDRPGYLAAVDRSAATLEQFFYEWRTLTPSGKVIWLQANSQPELRPNGDLCWHGIVLDVSERKTSEAERHQAEEALRQSEERFRNLFENAPVAYQSLDEHGFYIDVNPELCKLLGYSREDLLGHHFAEFWAPSLQPRFLRDFGCFKKTGHTRAELQLVRKNHVQITVLLEGRIQQDARGQFVKTHCILYNITKRKQMEEALRRAETKLRQANHELERLVNTDALTQVANRRYFDIYLLQEWRRSAREKLPISLILFDVDYFKRFNDTYGHPAGDHCLRHVAWAAQRAIQRSSDLVARYGGEEFVVILPNTNLEGAVVVVEQIRQQIRSLSIPHGQSEMSPFVTVSAGISTMIPRPHSDPSILVQQADQALYSAKQQGRDRYVILPSLES